jgi:hypothetical protein
MIYVSEPCEDDGYRTLWYSTRWLLLIPIIGWGMFALAWALNVAIDGLEKRKK